MADRILLLAADMLDALAAEWAGAICNDWDPPDDMSNEDRARLARIAWESNGSPPDEDPNEPVRTDFVAAYGAAEYVRRLASEVTDLRARIAELEARHV
jgi:hypothetical protein